MPAEPAKFEKALAFADAYLKWKTRPRFDGERQPNPLKFGLTPEDGNHVIETCHRAVEDMAVERATRPYRTGP